MPDVQSRNPTYADDFWSKPGYLGTEKSELGDFIRGALIDFNATVQNAEVDASVSAINITLDKIPAKSSDHRLEFIVYGNDNSKFGTVTGKLDARTKKVSFYDGNNVTTVRVIRNGTKLKVIHE